MLNNDSDLCMRRPTPFNANDRAAVVDISYKVLEAHQVKSKPKGCSGSSVICRSQANR